MITWPQGPINSRRTIVTGIAGLAVVAGFVSPAAGAWGSGSASTLRNVDHRVAPGLTQTKEARGVTIVVTWQGPRRAAIFTVAMNSHVVDLDSYDLRKLAVLRTNQGFTARPTRWTAPTGGHHREGQLIFPKRSTTGHSLSVPATRTMELVIRHVAGVPERTFTWTITSN